MLLSPFKPFSIQFGHTPAKPAHPATPKRTLDSASAPAGLNYPQASRQLVASVRDRLVECTWDASAVVANDKGQLIQQFGNDPNFLIIPRSSIKPLHAMALAEVMLQKGIPLNSIPAKSWAVLCASHTGTQAHREAIETVMKQFDLSPENLVCGTHPPLDTQTAHQLIQDQQASDTLHHQCAGHHTCQNILAKLQDFSVKNYAEPDGPTQQFFLEYLRTAGGDPSIKLVKSDGCNIPTYGVPMITLAQLFAKLGSDPRYQPIRDALTQHPELIGGQDTVDASLIRVTHGQLIAKIGNDGLICVARRPQSPTEEPKALILKLWAGNGNHDPVRDKLVIETLANLGWLTPEQVSTLRQTPSFDLIERNTLGPVKGQIKLRYHIKPLPWQKDTQPSAPKTISFA